MAFRVRPISEVISNIMNDFSLSEEQADEVWGLGDKAGQRATIGGIEFESSTIGSFSV